MEIGKTIPTRTCTRISLPCHYVYARSLENCIVKGYHLCRFEVNVGKVFTANKKRGKAETRLKLLTIVDSSASYSPCPHVLNSFPLWKTFSNFKRFCFWLTFSWDTCGREPRTGTNFLFVKGERIHVHEARGVGKKEESVVLLLTLKALQLNVFTITAYKDSVNLQPIDINLSIDQSITTGIFAISLKSVGLTVLRSTGICSFLAPLLELFYSPLSCPFGVLR